MNTTKGLTSLHLTVNNHPGVMSHVCGLFARRAFNLEGILVTPSADAGLASIWLLVKKNDSLEQMVRQVRKLHDVKDVQIMDVHPQAFERLSACMGGLEQALA